MDDFKAKIARRMVERDIETANKRMQRLNDQIGKLMGDRIAVENELAALYEKREGR